MFKAGLWLRALSAFFALVALGGLAVFLIDVLPLQLPGNRSVPGGVYGLIAAFVSGFLCCLCRQINRRD